MRARPRVDLAHANLTFKPAGMIMLMLLLCRGVIHPAIRAGKILDRPNAVSHRAIMRRLDLMFQPKRLLQSTTYYLDLRIRRLSGSGFLTSQSQSTSRCRQRRPLRGWNGQAEPGCPTSGFVQVCGWRPMKVARRSRARRPQTCRGGKRGRRGEVVRQALWGFSCCRSFAEVGWEFSRQAIADATKRVGRLQGAEWELGGGDGMRRRLS